MPLPRAPEERVGQGLEMLPALALAIIASTGSEHMQMGVILPIAAMGVEDGNIPAGEGLPLHGAIEIIEALGSTTHKSVTDAPRVLVEGHPEHRRHRQDDVSIDDPLVQYFAHLADPGIRINLGTP